MLVHPEIEIAAEMEMILYLEFMVLRLLEQFLITAQAVQPSFKLQVYLQVHFSLLVLQLTAGRLLMLLEIQSSVHST